MQRWFRFGFWITSVLLSFNIFASTDVLNDQFIQRKIKNFMQRYRVSGAAVTILSHGKLKTYVFGEAVPAKHIPVTENTIFELGSITKTFTGLLLAQHVLAGKTNLTAPISSYLERPHSKSIGNITYLQLATHVSGLPFNAKKLPYNASSSFVNKLKLHYYLRKSVPQFYPSSQMLYSNFAYGILGRILAKQEHTDLTLLMKSKILMPLNMQKAGLDINENNQRYLAQGYTADGRPARYMNAGLFGGAWAMRASAKDMGQYLKAAVGDSSVPSSLQQAMHYSQISHYALVHEDMQFGLGWVVTPLNQRNAMQKLIKKPEHYHFVPTSVRKIHNPRFNPHALIGKTGATDGFRSYIAVIPDKKVGIVVMTNRFTRSHGQLTSIANEILLRIS